MTWLPLTTTLIVTIQSSNFLPIVNSIRPWISVFNELSVLCLVLLVAVFSELGRETIWFSLLRTCLDIDVLQIPLPTNLTYAEVLSAVRTAISMWEEFYSVLLSSLKLSPLYWALSDLNCFLFHWKIMQKPKHVRLLVRLWQIWMLVWPRYS